MSHEELYISGFNDGYYLRGHASQVATSLKEVPSNDPYLQAVQYGIDQKEYELEAERGKDAELEQLNELEQLRSGDERELDEEPER